MDSIGWLGVIFISIWILMVGIAIGDGLFSTHTEIFVDNQLRTLQDESAIHGRFSLGSGTIDEEQILAYYMVEGNGYVLRSSPASMSKIIEDEEDNPYIRTFISRNEGAITGWITQSIDRFEFHVPKGTIIDDKFLDAKSSR